MSNLQSLSLYWPELILSVTILLAIIIDIFSESQQSKKVSNWVTLGLLLTLIAVVLTKHTPTTLFMDTLAFDPFASFIKSIVIIATILVIAISRNSNEFKGYHTGEYYALLAVMVFGMFPVSYTHLTLPTKRIV